jgi:hypothetical protein
MSTKRQVFYSFHYDRDCWRAATVRSIGAIEGNRPAPDNDWETIKKGGDLAIKKWIQDQLKGRSCTVVLIGTETAGRKWINHEISESWNAGMGVVGLRIHGLKNKDGYISDKGGNPFDHVTFTNSGKELSSIVECYTPTGENSKERYAWICDHISNIIEKAIKIRAAN